MEEKTSTLTIRQTGTDQYAVTIPEIGATLESALKIIMHDIVKHLTTRSLILVFVDQQVDRDGGYFDAQGDPHTDLEQQAVVGVTQLGIAPQMKRKERHLLFEYHARSHEHKPHGSMSRQERSSKGTTSKTRAK